MDVYVVYLLCRSFLSRGITQFEDNVTLYKPDFMLNRDVDKNASIQIEVLCFQLRPCFGRNMPLFTRFYFLVGVGTDKKPFRFSSQEVLPAKQAYALLL